MDGLAKTAQSQEIQIPLSIPETANIPVLIDGTPIELMDYFDLDIRDADSRAKGQLRDIYSMTQEGARDIGDILSRMRNIERQLGHPSFGETRYGKIWNWLKISGRINDLMKQQEAMKG